MSNHRRRPCVYRVSHSTIVERSDVNIVQMMYGRMQSNSYECVKCSITRGPDDHFNAEALFWHLVEHLNLGHAVPPRLLIDLESFARRVEESRKQEADYHAAIKRRNAEAEARSRPAKRAR